LKINTIKILQSFLLSAFVICVYQTAIFAQVNSAVSDFSNQPNALLLDEELQSVPNLLQTNTATFPATIHLNIEGVLTKEVIH